MQLAGKTVLITGGRRLGARLALMLAARGANLAFSYYTSPDGMQKVVEECRLAGVQAESFRADLRNPEEADLLVQQTVTRFGSLNVLVNLTSVYTRTPLETLQAKDYFESIASNLSAPYFTAIAAARAMLQQPVENGLQGKIIHFTDWAVDRPYRHFVPYLVAKGGLVALTRALAVELAPTITVNAIAPGTVEPGVKTSDEKLDRIRELSALHRIGSPDDVNQAVMYLLEGTDFVTGEVYRVDGGRFLGSTTGDA